MFQSRGILIHPSELEDYWLAEAKAARLDVLGLHPVGGAHAARSLEELVTLHASAGHAARLEKARSMGLRMEYETHALGYLLPRALFDAHPEWFRMDETGRRVADYNLCASNRDALDYLSERAQTLAKALDTGERRRYFWPDDVHGYACHCPECAKLSPSDQALRMVNAIAKGVRRYDPEGRCAFLAYQDTMTPPTEAPEDGVFLEFAPIFRDSHRPIADETCEQNAREMRTVKELLAYFGREGSQVLEYWIDNSRFSGWTKPPKPMTLDEEVMARDVETYDTLGFERVTSFGCYLGADYRALYGQPPIARYGEILRGRA